jgi:hypothetical protein
MPITVTALKWVPPFAQGNVRDRLIPRDVAGRSSPVPLVAF